MTNTNNTNPTLLATNTENVPAGTPVTIRIGSDRYAGVVVKSTARTMTVTYTEGGLAGNELIFRLTTKDALYYTHKRHHYIARIGEAIHEMDRGF